MFLKCNEVRKNQTYLMDTWRNKRHFIFFFYSLVNHRHLCLSSSEYGDLMLLPHLISSTRTQKEGNHDANWNLRFGSLSLSLSRRPVLSEDAPPSPLPPHQGALFMPPSLPFPTFAQREADRGSAACPQKMRKSGCQKCAKCTTRFLYVEASLHNGSKIKNREALRIFAKVCGNTCLPGDLRRDNKTCFDLFEIKCVNYYYFLPLLSPTWSREKGVSVGSLWSPWETETGWVGGWVGG